MTPGPTRYATSRVDDIKSSFQLFLPESIVEILLAMTNLEGGRVFADTWKALDQVDLQAYMGLLILAGVHRSNMRLQKVCGMQSQGGLYSGQLCPCSIFISSQELSDLMTELHDLSAGETTNWLPSGTFGTGGWSAYH